MWNANVAFRGLYAFKLCKTLIAKKKSLYPCYLFSLTRILQQFCSLA